MLDFLPWWAWAILLGVVVLTVMRLFGVRQALVAAAVSAAALFYRKGRDDGRQAVEREVERRRAESVRARRESDDAVDRMDASERDSEWSRWLRDGR